MASSTCRLFRMPKSSHPVLTAVFVYGNTPNRNNPIILSVFLLRICQRKGINRLCLLFFLFQFLSLLHLNSSASALLFALCSLSALIVMFSANRILTFGVAWAGVRRLFPRDRSAGAIASRDGGGQDWICEVSAVENSTQNHFPSKPTAGENN